MLHMGGCNCDSAAFIQAILHCLQDYALPRLHHNLSQDLVVGNKRTAHAQVVSGMGLSDVYEYLSLKHPDQVDLATHR
jgi:hypothetical protein